jgi:predicted metal-binding membrane protein
MVIEYTTATAGLEMSRVMGSDRAFHRDRASDRAFFGVSALLFAASAALTIIWCGSMSAMGGMLMPGGWMMSMAWMRMPGQTWPGAAAAFLGMWIVMMVAMMLPSLMPMLWRYRKAVRSTGDDMRAGVGLGLGLGALTTIAGAGYFFVWTVVGLIVFPVGVALAELEMQQPALARVVPFTSGVVVLIAGAIQFTAWKAHHLACCRAPHTHAATQPPNATTAWREGIRLGLQCGHCCANLMVILLVLGVMDLAPMVAVTIAITAERLTPTGNRVARATGTLIIIAGLFLIAQAAGLA